MEQTTDSMVVGVRFSKVGKVYDFESNGLTDLKVGDQVVVETTRGWQLGQVAKIVEDAQPPPEGWKSIDRRATPRDLLLRQMWQQREAEVVTATKTRAGEIRLQGIKIVSAEYSFDGSRLTILFSSETEEKYDLKSLRQDMQKLFAPSQVEMRQIGPRDVAKTTCGMGACGLEKRCCCSFLTEFSSISIRMAKEQGISLTPTEITGMCGRLRCCLIYEYDTYVDARQTLPKRNKRVRTPQGDGKVIDVAPLRGTVIVDLPEVGYREFPGSDIALIDENGEVIETQPAGRPAMPPVEAAAVEPSAPEENYLSEYDKRPAIEPSRRSEGRSGRGGREQRGPRNEPRPAREEGAAQPGRQGQPGRGQRPERGGQEGKAHAQNAQKGAPSGEANAPADRAQGGAGNRGPQSGGPARSGQRSRSRRSRGGAEGGQAAAQNRQEPEAPNQAPENRSGGEQQPGEKRRSSHGPRDHGSRGGRDSRQRKGKQHGSDGSNKSNEPNPGGNSEV